MWKYRSDSMEVSLLLMWIEEERGRRDHIYGWILFLLFVFLLDFG